MPISARDLRIVGSYVITAVFGALLWSGCVSVDLKELAAYERATAGGEGPQRPRLLLNDSYDWADFPKMTPFAVVVAVRGAGYSPEATIREVWHHGAELRPDVIRIVQHFDENLRDIIPGIHNYWSKEQSPAWGVLGICLRISSARLPSCEEDDVGFLTDICSDLRNVGILEGDRVSFVDGFAVDRLDKLASRHHERMLQLTPGQEVVLTTVRLGLGRTDVTVKAVENVGRDFSMLPDAIPWERPEEDKD
jgi:hypothetical protein